jgi:beta-N-acetylhexosaminidase
MGDGAKWMRAAATLCTLALVAGCTAQGVTSTPVPAPTGSGVEPPPPPDPVVQYAEDRLSVMSLEQKIASMLMIHVGGVDPGLIRSMATQGVGGVILMGDNMPDPPEQLATMTPALSPETGLPLLVGIDQEGGIVARVWTDAYDSAAQLRFLPPEAAESAFDARGAMLAGLGITVNFGIVADVTGDPSSFIYERSMGSSPEDAAARVAAAVAGEQGHVLSTLKHFPGHGVSPGDSHSSIPGTGMSMAEWQAGHEGPFAAGIDAGAEFVMFGHLRFDAFDPVPATLSPMWHALLRDDLGFDGIIITDDMAMLENSGEPAYADRLANAVAAIAAGNTMLLYVAGVDVASLVTGIAAAVRAGALDEELINDAALRLLELRRKLSGETGRFSHCFEECQEMVE